MKILRGVIKDSPHLMTDIGELHPNKEDMVVVEINLPDYLDITSLLAMDKRLNEIAKFYGIKLRLLGRTLDLETEKYATKLFSVREDLYLTIDWRPADD